MRTLATRAVRACAAATLVFCFSFTPSYARMGAGGAPFARPAFGMGHFSRFTPHGFNRRFDFGHFGFNRFGPNQFDRFGSSRFNRNPPCVGGWGWGGFSVSTAASEPIVVGGGAPVIINIRADPGPSGARGCVIHKLMYDSNGKYVGERQSQQC
jgi:hypothetical protein